MSSTNSSSSEAQQQPQNVMQIPAAPPRSSRTPRVPSGEHAPRGSPAFLAWRALRNQQGRAWRARRRAAQLAAAQTALTAAAGHTPNPSRQEIGRKSRARRNAGNQNPQSATPQQQPVVRPLYTTAQIHNDLLPVMQHLREEDPTNPAYSTFPGVDFQFNPSLGPTDLSVLPTTGGYMYVTDIEAMRVEAERTAAANQDAIAQAPDAGTQPQPNTGSSLTTPRPRRTRSRRGGK